VDDEIFTCAVSELTTTDPNLADLVAAHGIPTLWRRPPGFASLVLFVLEQQVSLASAAAAYAKVLTRVGVVAPATVLATTAEQLRLDGVSRQKDRYLRALATAVQGGELDLDALVTLEDHEVRASLLALPGIGPWTADVYLLACLGRPDVWPAGDRALQVSVAESLALHQVPDRGELLAIGDRWRPYRSTAARLLWHGYLSRRGRGEMAEHGPAAADAAVPP
jgi:DNA-3-methyladenine glycosylase II